MATLAVISRQTVTRQIRALEALIGAPLFHAVSSQSVLTPAGAARLDFAKSIYRDLQDFTDPATKPASQTPKTAAHVLESKRLSISSRSLPVKWTSPCASAPGPWA